MKTEIIPERQLTEIKDLRPGDHILSIFENDEEHFSQLAAYLRAGLTQQEKVLCIVHTYDMQQVLHKLTSDELTLESYTNSKKLSLLNSENAYLPDAIFNPDARIAFFQEQVRLALAEGYSALRVVSEMSWVLEKWAGSERFIEYESKLNSFLQGNPCIMMCHYDRWRFTPEMLLEVLTAHPLVILGNKVHDNFYYVPSSEVLDGDREAAVLRRYLEHLQKHKRLEENLKENYDFVSGLIENSPNPTHAVNCDTSIKYINPALTNLTGFSPEELIGKKAPYPWWIEKTTFKMFKEALEKGSDQRELLFQKKNGQRIWVEVNFRQVKNGTGHYYLITWTDITELKRLQDNLEFYILQLTRLREEEKKFIAQELHEEILQLLANQKMDLEALAQKSELDVKTIRENIQELATRASSLMEEIRNLSYQIRPGVIEHLGLISALELLVENLQREGVQAWLNVTGRKRELPLETSVYLFRIAQEAMDNILKHAHATEAAINVQFCSKKFTMSIVDNGRGFAVPRVLGELVNQHKLGLINIEKRALLIRAKLNIHSKIDYGTVVKVELEV